MEQAASNLRFFGLGPHELPAVLRTPEHPRGLILFAHGSDSSHRSPRNNMVAEQLSASGFATLLFDLLTPTEAHNRANVFNIELLAARLIDAITVMSAQSELAGLPIGLFGASTGAGAALLAAANSPVRIAAVVSRGGRPDLAGADALSRVICPVQLIVGGEDPEVIALNRAAALLLGGQRELVIIPGAGHLFGEPGTLDQVVDHARQWFSQHLLTTAAPQ